MIYHYTYFIHIAASTQKLMTFQIRLRIEYLLPTYNILFYIKFYEQV